jgi:hypothetical protein
LYWQADCAGGEGASYSTQRALRTQRSEEKKGFGQAQSLSFRSNSVSSVLLGCSFFAGREDSPQRRDGHKTSWTVAGVIPLVAAARRPCVLRGEITNSDPRVHAMLLGARKFFAQNVRRP